MADDTAARETQIGTQSRYLIEQLERAANELKHLKERLAPVLSQPTPTAAPIEKRDSPSNIAPHALFLKDQGDKVAALADGITALRQRVEL